MSEAARELLSRDEMTALLDAVADRQRKLEERGSVFKPRVEAIRDERELRPLLRRSLEGFAAHYGKAMSGRFQTPIVFELLSWEERSVGDLVGGLLPEDALVSFEDRRSEGLGLVLLNRPLTFSWLALAFGAGERGSGALPKRRHTRIEQHFLKRIASEVLERLVERTKDELSLEVEVRGIEDAQSLADRRDQKVSLVSFDVSGLGELCRLRVGLPAAALASAKSGGSLRRRSSSVGSEMLGVPVTVRAELGRAALPVGRLGALQVGEWIAIDGSDEGVLSLRIEGAAKFSATRGRRGARLAVRIVERLKD